MEKLTGSTLNNEQPRRRLYIWLAWLLVIAVVVLPRVLDLDVFYARDELAIWLWADEFTLAVWDGNLAGTLTTSNYPGIPIFWAQTLFLTFKYNLPSLFPQTMTPLESLLDNRSLDLLAERRLVVGLFVSMQIIVAVWLVQRLIDWKVALLSAVFMGLDPFSLTEARVFRLEMISAYFVCLSILCYFMHLRWRQLKWVLLSGIMAGLGVSSKTSAGLIVPYIWLLLLLDLLLANRAIDRSTHPLKRVIADGLIWAAGAIGAFWAIWPAMWVKPFEAIEYIFLFGLSQAAEWSVWGDKVFFWGQVWPGDPGPFFYPVVFAFRTTPLTWIGLMGAAVFAGFLIYRPKFVGNSKASSHNPFLWGFPWPAVGTILLLAGIILITLELSFVISKVDRFLLIVFPLLSILSAVGLAALIGWLVGWLADTVHSRYLTIFTTPQTLFASLFIIVLGFQFAITYSVHPYYFAYWNPWVGGGRAAMEILPLGSGEGIDLAMDYLNNQPDVTASSVICGASQPWCENKFSGQTLRSATYASGEWAAANYASFYISHLQRQNNPAEVVEFFMSQEPLYRVELQGATYVWVYKVPDMGHFAGAWNDLDGLGRLLGYDFGESSRQVGDTVEATVWWVNMGAGVDQLILRWLDETGYEWGRAKVVPWREYVSIPPEKRAVVAGTATFTIPPGTPPGLYFLRIAAVEPETGRLLGQFAMPDTTDQLAVVPGQIITDPTRLTIARPVRQLLAPEITLLGYAPPEQVLTAESPTWVTLYWQAVAEPADYVVTLRLLDAVGHEVAHWEGRPGHGYYPTSDWLPGEIVRDVWALQVEPETPIGQYSLEVLLSNPDHPPTAIATISDLQVWSQPIRYDKPNMQAELQVNFGDRLTLLGYDLYFDTDGSGSGKLSPVFYWRSQADFEEAFDILVTLRTADSNEIIKMWQVPLGRDNAKSYWMSGEVVNTSYQFEVEALVGGRYHLDIALKNRASDRIEPIVDGVPETAFTRIEDIQDRVVVRVTDQD